MGIIGALFSGVSGLDVYGSSIEVIGNNIANANTPGFKGSRAEFSDILSQSLTGAAAGNQIGRGVQLSSVLTLFSQGSFQTTSSGTDLAVDGQGFFIVKNPDGSFFTRAGQFRVDEEGLLVNNRGDKVQGFTLDLEGNPTGTIGDLNLTAGTASPRSTGKVTFVANLDAAAKAIGTAGNLKSGASVASQFLFVTGQNENIRVDGTTTLSLITAGGLTSDTPVTGSAVATAIQTALTTLGGGRAFTVNYNTSTNRFEISQTAGAAVTINWTSALSTAAASLGFSTNVDDTLSTTAVTSDNPVQFNVVSGSNTFTITTDGQNTNNKFTGNVIVTAGAYTGDQLAQELERAINASDDATTNRLRSVRVTFNEDADNRFKIISQATGAARTINISSNSQKIELEASFVSVTNSGITQTIKLDSTSTPVSTVGTGGFSVTDPSASASSNFSTSVTLFDSLGTAHAISIFFRKVGENIWEYNGTMLGSELLGPTAATANEQVLFGRLVFNTTGALDLEEKFVSGVNGVQSQPLGIANVFNFSGGAAQSQSVNFDFGTSKTSDAGTGLDGVTQFAGTSSILNQVQDGFTTGTLQSLSFNRDGNVTGSFTNGQTRDLARIMLANFLNPNGLASQGNNLFGETQQSGQPIIGQPNTSGFGTVFANAVELSNVDIAEEFVRLIQEQQAFSANARLISGTRELLDEIVNLVR